MKALIVYGTRYGATAGTSKEIARILRAEKFDVKVVNAKEEKADDISEFNLIIVGSGIKNNRWTTESERFLKKFNKKLAKKKVAIFVSSGLQAIFAYLGKTDSMKRARIKHLEEKAEKYSLNPVDMVIFGGLLNFEKMGLTAQKTIGKLWRKIEEVGFEKKDGIYDTRDWKTIQNWTEELVKKVRF
jgi:menaquinone-dependent protoporphyrinogen IX oxidase